MKHAVALHAVPAKTGMPTNKHSIKLMKPKNQRLQAIQQMIRQEVIRSQDALQKRLKEEGFHVTQATLSRDLRHLRIARVAAPETGYMYALPALDDNDEAEHSARDFAVRGFRSIAFAHNMAVLKTLPGYANSIAYAIDHLKSPAIIGTVAGDDTILLIPAEHVREKDLRAILAQIIPEINQ